MATRLLVTGAGGFIAGSVITQAPEYLEVHALSRGPALLQRPSLYWHTLDPLVSARLEDAVRAIAPTCILHTAALADIDYCDTHREEAHRVNVGLTRQLVALAAKCGARLVYLSTDNAFDGRQGHYTEDDPVSPINYYGETKTAAERFVAEMGASWVVARVSLVMGLPMLAAGNSFLSRMILKLEQGEQVAVPAGEIRSPIDVVTLGQALLELVEHEYSGRLHLSGDDVLSRFELAQRIAGRLGYSVELVAAGDPAKMRNRAPRPRDVSLANDKGHAVLQAPLCGVDEGLERILAAPASTGRPRRTV